MRRVLVIDDDPAIGHIVSLALGAAGWQVESATSGRQGLRKVRSFQPSLVLLDHQMPEMGGLETLMALRRSGQQVPVIVLTATRDEATQARFVQEGALGVLTKPFDPLQLAADIANLDQGPPEKAARSMPEGLRSTYAAALRDELQNLADLLPWADEPIPPGLALHAHRIAGTAGAYGFPAVSAAARAIEVALETEAPDWESLRDKVLASLP